MPQQLPVHAASNGNPNEACPPVSMVRHSLHTSRVLSGNIGIQKDRKQLSGMLRVFFINNVLPKLQENWQPRTLRVYTIFIISDHKRCQGRHEQQDENQVQLK
jgi:hypothetical protein